MTPARNNAPMPYRRAACIAAVAVAAASSAAEAQRLSPLPEEPIPGFFDTSWLGPSTVESGSLVVFARELGPNRPRAVRVGATGGVTDEPGLEAASVASCGGGRWVVTARTERRGGTTYALLRPGGSVVWSRAFPPLSLPSVAVQCAGATALLGWVDDGELVLAEASGNALGPERRTRISATGTRGVTVWAALSPTELFVAANVLVPNSSTELLRIAGATITHRRSLGRANDVRLALAPGRLLAAFHDERGAATVASFALADLAPGPVATIPARERGRRASVASVWPGPDGIVALSIHEGWEGPGFVAIPQGPNEPDRHEPAYHTAAYLMTWAPASGRLGPATDFGAEGIGPGAWLGPTLVVIEPLRRDRNYPNEVRLYPARVRRFSLSR